MEHANDMVNSYLKWTHADIMDVMLYRNAIIKVDTLIVDHWPEMAQLGPGCQARREGRQMTGSRIFFRYFVFINKWLCEY